MKIQKSSLGPGLIALAASIVNAQVGAIGAQLRLGYLNVPGASLYYEVVGTGPLLIFISGQNGDADIWRDVATALQNNFTVAAYDRRGFSRSYLSTTAAQDYENRLATDANDVRLLIEHLSLNKTGLCTNGTSTTAGSGAYVMGSSSGAIVALELLARFPTHLRALMVHEPPAVMILPDNATLAAGQERIYATYRRAGIPPAMFQFLALYGGGGIGANGTAAASEAGAFLRLMDPRASPFISGNTQYWFERELLPYPLHRFDLDAMLAGGEGLLVPVVGAETDPGALHYRANVVLAEKFGTDLVVLPGGHVGYATEPAAFGAALLAALAKREGLCEARWVGSLQDAAIHGVRLVKKGRFTN